MEIQSVNASVSSYVTSGTQTRQAQQEQSVQQAQQFGSREAEAQERVEAEQAAQRPVTNAQGQQTGTLINVTA